MLLQQQRLLQRTVQPTIQRILKSPKWRLAEGFAKLGVILVVAFQAKSDLAHLRVSRLKMQYSRKLAP